MVVDEQALARKLAALRPYLDERQRRLWLGVEAREIGHGGIAAVARAAGVSWPTVSKAVKELDQPAEAVAPAGRARRPGGGRKPLTARDPGLVAALEALIDPDTRGDPESPLRWTCKSTRQLADTLTAAGHPVSHSTVGDLLRGLGTACRPTPRPARAPDTRTETSSSATWPPKSKRIWTPASR